MIPTPQNLRLRAKSHGLQLLGITDLTPLDASEKPFYKWLGEGFAADLAYMLKGQETFLKPQAFYPSAKSCLCFAIFYSSTEPGARPAGFGRVARYAWGRDYHRVIKRRIESFRKDIERQVGRSLPGRVVTDSAPLLERALAHRAGLGFHGKNSMLIHPGRGSLFLLGELFWELECEPGQEAADGRCGTCVKCLDACPSGAIVEPGVLDSRRCISYLTIEKRGMLTEGERAALGDWVFGCDVCQEVCPHNHRALKMGRPADIPEIEREPGVGPFLNLEQLLNIRRQEDFLRVFAGTALMRAKREGLMRNALCVAANTGAESLERAILACALEDSSAVVRAHALWALSVLASLGAIGTKRSLVESALKDPALEVRQEAGRLLEGEP